MKLTQLTAEEKLTYVGLLTELQKDELLGQLYAPDSYFNPIQDINNNWIISTEEMEQCINPEYLWVKDLELIPYEPKPTPPING
jgi:predicted DNA-binding transcriptional regulator